MFGQVIVQMQPSQSAVIVDMEGRGEILGVCERCRIQVDFTRIMIRLKRHRRAAGVAKMTCDAFGGVELFRGLACPFKASKGRAQKGDNGRCAVAAAIGAVAMAGPCLRAGEGECDVATKTVACGGLGHN